MKKYSENKIMDMLHEHNLELATLNTKIQSINDVINEYENCKQLDEFKSNIVDINTTITALQKYLGYDCIFVVNFDLGIFHGFVILNENGTLQDLIWV